MLRLSPRFVALQAPLRGYTQPKANDINKKEDRHINNRASSQACASFVCLLTDFSQSPRSGTLRSF